MPSLTAQEFYRLANNFYNAKGMMFDYNRIAVDAELVNYFNIKGDEMKKKVKVAFCCICLNQHYWQYIEPMIRGAKQFFLPGHKTDFFLWSDIPPDAADLEKKQDKNSFADGFNSAVEQLTNKKYGATIFPTTPEPWPIPTLMRYHLFLQQEEILKEYDYIFYCDVDMRFVNIVGDEILGEALTVAPHPGYYIRKELYPPYEPSKDSASFIKRPGFIINDGGKPRFMPYYVAGGFQGGRTAEWFKAMRIMKDLVDKDLAIGYYPIWNDETVWNKYLFDVLPTEELMKNVFLTPSYIYPDSLIKEYYEPIVWGTNYEKGINVFPPKLITLTKSFSVSKEGGDAVQQMIQK